MPRPVARIEVMRAGEHHFLQHVDALDAAGLDGATLLPDWSRREVVAHVARNADAVRNLLVWARTGEATPMYSSLDARAEDIERTARQGAADLCADVREASARLLADVDDLPEAAWDTLVRTARGRTITATEVPWMRSRESWVHAVDLGTGASFHDLPQSVVDGLLAEVTVGLLDREDCAGMVLRADDTGAEWGVGPSTEPVGVRGHSADLLAWLIGRSDGAALAATTPDGRPPVPPRWL